jgi:uncharacterized protein (DUF2249 family)/quercetin dioxygenase-like cupin family protein
MPEQTLDVRPLRKPDRHPTIFAAYEALAAGESLVLVNNHDPKHLHDEFKLEHPGSHGWNYLERGPETWRIRISKITAAPLPRIVHDMTGSQAPDATGAIWRLQMRDRDLDSNIIHLPPGVAIGAHNGPDLDILLHILHGGGRLATELTTLDLRPGVLVWLPRRSRREFTAGPEGLSYLTVHQRRQALVLDAAARRAQR